MTSKRRTAAGASRGSKIVPDGASTTLSGRSVSSGTFTVAHLRRAGQATASTETIEARLERKAAEADGKVFATTSLGQMSYDERDKLLFGE